MIFANQRTPGNKGRKDISLDTTPTDQFDILKKGLGKQPTAFVNDKLISTILFLVQIHGEKSFEINRPKRTQKVVNLKLIDL